MIKQPAVYIVASRKNGAIYTGVTSNLPKRIYEHKNSLVPGFTAKYSCKVLVFFEFYGNMVDAITREKQIKGGSRARKLALIEKNNPNWNDLYSQII